MTRPQFKKQVQQKFGDTVGIAYQMNEAEYRALITPEGNTEPSMVCQGSPHGDMIRLFFTEECGGAYIGLME